MKIEIDQEDFNPNHKYRFCLIIPTMTEFYRLMTLSFKQKDNSIYLALNIQKEITIVGTDFKGNNYTLIANPKSDLHLSFHDISGVVNIGLNETTGRKQSYRLRKSNPNSLYGHLITLGINNPNILMSMSMEEFNDRGKSSNSVSPLIGFPNIPVFISVFRSSIKHECEIPQLSSYNFPQMNWHVGLRNKDIRYSFVTWQNGTVPSFKGEIAFDLKNPIIIN